MPLLIYTLLRVLLVVVAGGALYLLGMRGLLLVVVAVVVGALLSFLLLKGPRDRAAQTLQGFAEREPAPTRPDADSVAEDEDLDRGSAEPEDESQRDAER
ncbi:DUF4229 domain-containing protein [Pseudactinotalea suaedae]|uniref:DUF4229 domain-containing protein n=1 Tax=Pseudactinotalea suaedae TaxID=1524924 RepID=UPI0012E161C9|nr:DUF4229 domain-containing protein [Pseudactinotalea suaedae]